MGTKVHLINRNNNILTFIDKEIVEHLFECMRQDEIDLLFNMNVQQITVPANEKEELQVELNDGRILKVDIKNNIKTELKNFNKSIKKFVLHSNNKIIAVLFKNNRICIYNINKSKVISNVVLYNNIQDILFTPKGTSYSYLAVLDIQNNLINLYDAFTGDYFGQIKQHNIFSALSINKGNAFLITLRNGDIKELNVSKYRNFINKNNYILEQLLVLLSFSGLKKINLKVEKKYIQELLKNFSPDLKKIISNKYKINLKFLK